MLADSEGHACPICKGYEFQSAQLDLLKCVNCELVVSKAIWNSGSNETLEDEWFGDSYNASHSFWTDWFEAFNNKRTIKRLRRNNIKSGKLLEIGVGSGSFLNSAREAGFEVKGCDLSKALCRNVENKYNIDMHCGYLGDISDSEQFDVVVMNHVLEHVNQPVEFLNAVKRLMKVDGVLHIAVPNLDCYEAMLPGWTSYEPYHLSYFKPKVLSKAINNAGLAVKLEESHDSFSGWFLALLRTLMGVNKNNEIKSNAYSSKSDQNSGRSIFLMHTYRIAMIGSGLLTWPFRYIQVLLNRGDEIICIATKLKN